MRQINTLSGIADGALPSRSSNTIAKVISPPRESAHVFISARLVAGSHTIAGQLCELRLDHAKLHHEGAEVLSQSRRGHGTFDAA
jgi:hypothetical protein